MFERNSRCVDEIIRRLGDNGTSIQIALDGRHDIRWQSRDIWRYAVTRRVLLSRLCSTSRTTTTTIAHHGPPPLSHAARLRPVHEYPVQYPNAVYPQETQPSGAQFTLITCWTSFAQQHPDRARNEPTAIYGPLTQYESITAEHK